MREEEARLDKLESFLDQVDPPRSESEWRDPDSKVSNPMDAFKMIHRMTKEWPQIQKHSKAKTSKNSMLALYSDIERFKDTLPEDNDIEGSMRAVFRVQDTYNLTAKVLADGSLTKFGHPLTIEEIFEIGFIAVGLEKYQYAQMWFQEVLNRWPRGAKQIGFLDYISLLEYLTWSEFKEEMYESAIKHTKLILKLDPSNKAADTNMQVFKEALEEQNEKDKERKERKEKKKKKKRPKEDFGPFTMTDRYYRQCQGNEPMSDSMRRTLFCDLVHTPARFVLKPLKREQLFREPVVYMYHNALLDHEVDRIISISKPNLKRSHVHNPETGKLMYADYRVAKNTWLFDEQDELVANLFQRMGDITGLDMRYSEPLQVNNYGLGGYYEPHFDHSTEEQAKVFTSKWGGNRIATVMMYLSDVEYGGKTVFTDTHKGAVFTPEKGAVIHWYNLLRNGRTDRKTRHAGCPVVFGQKWIANLWIHEDGQMFRRKCLLDPYK